MKNVEKKTRPYIVPWKDLSDEVKEWDRNAVRELPGILAKMGYEIIRIPRAPEDTMSGTL